jgi:ribonucleoside-diphosphate reductase alpha chain
MQKVDDFYQLEKDKLAVEEFQKEVIKKYYPFKTHEQRLLWLIDNGYYIDFLDMYDMSYIVELINHIYSYEFEFQSYMAISKFYQSYALKTNDKKHYLETYEERIVACALCLAQGDKDYAWKLAESMIKQEYQPATPTFMNTGKARGGEMVSCFLLEMDDSLNSINYNMNTMGQLSKIGGGVACNLSKLRARGEAIKEVEGASSGVVPVMKLMEDTFSYVNQLGQRAGAGVAYLNIFHWDIEEFLSTKKISGDEKSRLQTLSIGVVIPDKFVELARENKPMYVFAPYTVYKQYGEHLDDLDIDKVYDDLVANPNIKKRQLDPRQLLTNIARTQFESGYPYIMYRSNANKVHALKELGDIKISNLCCEIMQLQETSEITDYGQDDIIKRDISCNLGSLNIANVMENKSIEQSVRVAMRALTQVSDMSNIANAPGVRKANEELHAVGLGAMNLHGYLAKNKIAYESKYAKDFVRTFFMMINFYSILASVEIAMEKKEVFKGFYESEYANGNYFKKYLENDYAPTTKKVQKLFEGINIPTQKDWEKLAVLVSKHGMYHAYRLAIAPTQSIGYVQNATPSIAPIVSTVETRTYGDSTTYYPMPYLSKNNFFFYQSAYDMDMMKVIDLFAEAQEHIDQGISLVLYVDSETPTSQLVRYYMYAHYKGLKSLYYTRTRLLSATECESCSV